MHIPDNICEKFNIRFAPNIENLEDIREIETEVEKTEKTPYDFFKPIEDEYNSKKKEKKRIKYSDYKGTVEFNISCNHCKQKLEQSDKGDNNG